MEKLRAYRIETIASGSYEGKSYEVTIQTDFVSPDRRLEVTIRDGQTTDTITIGQTQYSRFPGTETWQITSPSSTAGPGMVTGAVLVSEVISPLSEIVRLADEQIDGVACYHLKGTADIPSSMKGEIGIEYWIGTNDFIIRQARQISDISNLGNSENKTGQIQTVNIDCTIRYYDFNADITIEQPGNTETPEPDFGF